MIERKREIRRRRQRQEKRRKLRAKLAKAAPAERAQIEAKIVKTYPRLVTDRTQEGSTTRR